MRLAIGLVARAVVWGCFLVIVGDAVVTLWQRGQYVLAFVAAGVFPATIIIWPWTYSAFGVSLIVFFVAAAIAYPISTFIGGLDPIG
jgi:hypothetical protein